MFLFLFCLALLALGVADPFFSSLLYQTVPNQFCSRFYYRSGGIGCRTSLSGVSGVLLEADSLDELQKLQETKWDQIVILVNSTILSDQLVNETLQNKRIIGIAIYGTENPKAAYSPFSATPDGKGSPSEGIALHAEYEWNPLGSGFYYQDSSKPVVFVSDPDAISQLLSKAHQNAKGATSNDYIMEISSYMGPDEMNSVTCLSKGACVPMGGQSVWSLAGKRDTRPIILLATALDSVSNVYDAGEDELNAGVRLSVLLGIVKALETVQLQSGSKQLMIAFFEGESWGRVGSRFFLADLTDFKCGNEIAHSSSPFNDRMCALPLRLSLAFTDLDLSAIEKVIILDQLLPMHDRLFFHYESDVMVPPFSSVLSIEPSTIHMIPPGTGESFYQAGIKNTVVITGYDEQFTNPYYGSVYHEEIPEEKVNAITATLLDYILTELDLKGAASVSQIYLHSLLQCFSIDGNCTVIEEVMNYQVGSITKQLKGKPINKFVGTYHRGRYPLLSIDSSYVIGTNETLKNKKVGVYFSPSLLESFVQTSLTLTFNSNHTNVNCTSFTDCRSFENGYCVQGKCIASNAYYHNAVDPAVKVMGINVFSVDPADKTSPLYTEPYWGGYYGENPYVMVYQKTSPATEWITFIIGIVVVIVTCFLTHYFFANYGPQLKLGLYYVCSNNESFLDSLRVLISRRTYKTLQSRINHSNEKPFIYSYDKSLK